MLVEIIYSSMKSNVGNRYTIIDASKIAQNLVIWFYFPSKVIRRHRLLLRDFQLTRTNLITDIFWALAINGAANGKSGTQHLFHNTLQRLGVGFELELSCNLDDLIHSQVAIMLDVLFLFLVPRWLLESLDYKG